MPGERIGNSNQYLTISGVVSAPAYSWASDNNTGLYRIGADNIGVAANGAKVLDIATTGLTVTGAFASSNGVSSTLTTDATSSSTGSIITAGGISTQKALWVGTTTTLAGALTYGGVALSNAVTGTGNMVLSTSPTITTATLTSPAITIATAGSFVAPSFAAYLSAPTSDNKTGDGTVYAVVCDTEEWDAGSNFLSGIFTAPVTGKYSFTWQCRVENLQSNHTFIVLKLTTSDGRLFVGPVCSPYAIRETTSGLSTCGVTMTTVISLAAGQTVTPNVEVNGSGSSKVVGVYGSSNHDTRFSGYFVPG